MQYMRTLDGAMIPQNRVLPPVKIEHVVKIFPTVVLAGFEINIEPKICSTCNNMHREFGDQCPKCQ